jgi:hypothetical protein
MTRFRSKERGLRRGFSLRQRSAHAIASYRPFDASLKLESRQHRVRLGVGGICARETSYLTVRRLRAKPDNYGWSGGESELMEDTPHGSLDGMVVCIDWLCVVYSVRPEW